MQRQQILAPQQRLEERPPEERLRAAFGMKGYAIFDLKQRFGAGFLAVVRDNEQHTAVRVCRRQSSRFEAQCLEYPSSTSSSTFEEVRQWSRVDIMVPEAPLSMTEPGGPYLWFELVRKAQALEHGLNRKELCKDPVVRRAKAGPEGHLSRQMRGETEVREPPKRMIRIGSRRRRNVVLGGGRNFPPLGSG